MNALQWLECKFSWIY